MCLYPYLWKSSKERDIKNIERGTAEESFIILPSSEREEGPIILPRASLGKENKKDRQVFNPNGFLYEDDLIADVCPKCGGYMENEDGYVYCPECDEEPPDLEDDYSEILWQINNGDYFLEYWKEKKLKRGAKNENLGN